MTHRHSRTLLRIAAVMALIGLAFMVWSLLHPAAGPIIMAMTVGQGIGVLSLLLYLGIVLADLRTSNVLPDLPVPPEVIARAGANTGQYPAVRDPEAKPGSEEEAATAAAPPADDEDDEVPAAPGSTKDAEDAKS